MATQWLPVQKPCPARRCGVRENVGVYRNVYPPPRGKRRERPRGGRSYRLPKMRRWGYDTLMGMAASQSHIRCLDIQTPIFHDTYGDYPKVPDLRNDSRVRDRLYYACPGWIGRNVFFRWKTGHTPSEFTQRNRQLAAGAKALARYTNDRRFLYLPDIQSAAESWLPDMIGQYQKSKEAWNELTERWFGR